MGSSLRVAIQKSGRLSDESVRLLKDCGYQFEVAREKTALKVPIRNIHAEVLFLRDDDIPGYVRDGVVEAGVVGENVAEESGCGCPVLLRLGFGRCRLSLAVPRDSAWLRVSDLNGLSIATSYPRILSRFLTRTGLNAEIQEVSGATEIAPSIGVAQAIFDVVSSGSTLISNGLRELHCVMDSQAVLISSPRLADEKEALLAKVLSRIQAVERARRCKYILLNAPNERLEEIVSLLPGLRSPSIIPLAEPGWSSVHSVIGEDRFWEVLDRLESAGAQGILVGPIEKMIG